MVKLYVDVVIILILWNVSIISKDGLVAGPFMAFHGITHDKLSGEMDCAGAVPWGTTKGRFTPRGQANSLCKEA